MTTKVLYGLIITASVLLAVANIASQEYWIAIVAIVSGSTWLLLEIKTKEVPNAVFFVVFWGLVIIGAMRGIPVLYMLVALSADLAAWDLSRFQARIRYEEQSTSRALLELKHLQKLAGALSIGLLIALFPTFVQVSLSFVVFLFLLILMMLILRKSVLALRKETDIRN